MMGLITKVSFFWFYKQKIGQFSNNQYNGHGYLVDGLVTYEGEFVDGKYNGKGK